MPKSVTEAAEEYSQVPTGRTEHLDWFKKDGFLAGAEWMRKQFTLHGTTDCNACDDGRATLYATFEGRCIACEQSRYESTKEKE